MLILEIIFALNSEFRIFPEAINKEVNVRISGAKCKVLSISRAKLTARFGL